MHAPRQPTHATRRRRWGLRLLLSGTVLVLLAGFYLWFTLLSPFGFQIPEEYAEIDAHRDHRVFVYGTLRSPWVRRLVMGRSGTAQPARLPGYTKEALDLVPDAEGVTEGYTITVSAEELRRLDRYERLGVRYERFKMELEDGTSAWVYRRMPQSLAPSSKGYDTRARDGPPPALAIAYLSSTLRSRTS